jgi:hypothetical protein
VPSFQVFPKRRVDQSLIAGRASGSFRHFEKAIHNVLVEPDRDPRLACPGSGGTTLPRLPLPKS